jgi:hypothetical protein
MKALRYDTETRDAIAPASVEAPELFSSVERAAVVAVYCSFVATGAHLGANVRVETVARAPAYRESFWRFPSALPQ